MARRHPFLIPCLALALASGAAAQTQTDLIQLRDGKLQLPFLKNAPWVMRFDAAKLAAKNSGKMIFAYFTRSDERCFESIQLECGAFAEEAFAAFSKRVVPFCHITTRVKTDPDQQLFQALGFTTYPRMLFMDANGRVLYLVMGERLADFELGFAELTALHDLQKRVAGGDRDARYPLLRKQLELQHVEFPDATRAIKRLPELSKAQKAELAPLLLRAEVLHMVKRTDPTLPARAKTGERFHRMQKAGAFPTGEAGLQFWRHILSYAELKKKPQLYEDVLDTLVQEFPKLDFAAERQTLRKLQR